MLEPLKASLLCVSLLEHLHLGTSEMEQEVKVPAFKSDNLSLIFSISMVEGEN